MRVVSKKLTQDRTVLEVLFSVVNGMSQRRVLAEEKKDREMNKETNVYWESVPKCWYSIDQGGVAEFQIR